MSASIQHHKTVSNSVKTAALIKKTASTFSSTKTLSKTAETKTCLFPTAKSPRDKPLAGLCRIGTWGCKLCQERLQNEEIPFQRSRVIFFRGASAMKGSTGPRATSTTPTPGIPARSTVSSIKKDKSILPRN